MNVLKKLHQEHEAVNSILNEMEEAAFWAKWIAAARRFGRANVRLVAEAPKPRIRDDLGLRDETELVKAMKVLLERHIQEEEAVVWRNIRRHVPAAKRAKLDAKFLAARRQDARLPIPAQPVRSPISAPLFASRDARAA
jgi:hypothetical protein